MKAIVKTKWKPFQIEMKDVDVPKICQDEVLIKVTATGICGTDLEIYKATMLRSYQKVELMVKVGYQQEAWCIIIVYYQKR